MATVTPHTEMMNDLLKLAVDSGVSDVIVKSNKPGYVRLAGKLKPVDMDPITCPEAEAWVERLPFLIEQDTDLDLVTGAAGCILSLIGLHECRPSARTLAVARQCGRGTGTAWTETPQCPTAQYPPPGSRADRSSARGLSTWWYQSR